ncbi:MAG: N-acetylmuramoyl-L-alanine amidase [Chloroflexi bacterium]|nr:N-acetylmuramoyl-L-alanine amidase [Chloroflexota bacterium]
MKSRNLLLVLLFLTLIIGSPSRGAKAGADPIRSGTWKQTTAAEFRAGSLTDVMVEDKKGGELVLAPGAAYGVYVSSLFQAPFSFNALGAFWEAQEPTGSSIRLWVRSSADGRTWSQWLPFGEVDQMRGYGKTAADLVFTSGSYIQYRGEFTRSDLRLAPRLEEITINYIDSSPGPTLDQARATARVSAVSLGVPQPAIISRAGWGADESYRFYGGTEVWPPIYAPVRVAINHHTVTANDDPNPAATVRAIYYYHAVTLGWGDIGYNYLVDRFGNIYEGRYGGDDVAGGHAYDHNTGSVGTAALGTYASQEVSPQLLNSVANLLAWVSYRKGINPMGYTYFIDKTVPNVMGHQDVNLTSCPGATYYEQMPSLRSLIWNRLPPYGQAWVGHRTPTQLSKGQTITVAVTLRNSGTLTWTAGGDKPFRLGYKWYDSSGREYTQVPSVEYHTSLPVDVAPGQEVTISARLIVPQITGAYTLKWDMVQESVTWFSQVAGGNPTLDVTVQVTEAGYRAAWGSHNTPPRMAPGETVTVTMGITNTGAITWTASGSYPFHLGYHWYDQTGAQYVQSFSDDHRTSLPRDIGPGQGVTLNALLTAPRSSGPYRLKWDMVQELVTWFADRGSPTLDVDVQVSTYSVGWGSHNTPPGMTPGQTVTVTVGMTNTGAITWTASGSYPFHLGYHWYDQTGAQYVQPPADDQRTSLPRDIGPGQGVTLNALLTAPRSAGTYRLKWDMVQELVTWFANQGSPTLDVDIRVLTTSLKTAPSELTYTAPAGSGVMSQTLSLWSEGGGTFTWTATVTPTQWLSIAPSQGQLPATVTVMADATGLRAGIRRGQVAFTALAPVSDILTATLPVTLTLTLPPPTLDVYPSSPTLPVTGTWDVITRPFYLQGDGMASWAAAVSPTSWLRVEPPSGTLPGGFTLIIDPSRLTLGKHRGQVQMRGKVADKEVVTRTVSVALDVVRSPLRLFLPISGEPIFRVWPWIIGP